MDKNVVITGANRGIGLALAHHYSTNGSQVFAVCRNSSTTLDEMNNVTIVDGIDVTNLRNLQHLKSVMEGIKIDILINNAGILTEELLCEIDYERIEQQFKVNAMGPLRTTEALLNQLHTGAKVVLITSRMGSLADNSSGASYGYRMSKAALNAAGVSLATRPQTKGNCRLHAAPWVCSN